MPQVPINELAVLAAAVVSMIIGFLWYGPLFGKQWMALSGISKEQMDASKMKGMHQMYALTFIGTLLTSYVLAHAIFFASTYLEIEGLSAGLQGGFWNWLGFIAPVTLGMVLWENKPWKLWILNNGYYLVNFLIMGVILVLWK